MIIAFIGGLTTVALYFSYTHEQFVTIFNDYMAKTANLPDAYNAIIAKATQSGLTIPPNSMLTAVLAIPIGYFFFAGFTYSIYAAGEIKEPQKNSFRAVMIGLLAVFLIDIIGVGQLYNVIGGQFNDAITFLNANGANPLPVPPTGNFFAGLLAPSIAINALVQFSAFWAFLMVNPVVLIVCVRNIFAWSFDRVIPEKFASLTDYGAPWVALIVSVFAAWVMLTLYEFTTFFTYVVNYVVIVSVAFLITGVAALTFPYLRKDLFEQAPAIVKKRIGGIPFISIAGFLDIVLFLLVLYASFLLPAFSGAVGLPAILFVVGIYLTGLVGYYVARAYRKSTGLNLEMLHRQLPPE